MLKKSVFWIKLLNDVSAEWFDNNKKYTLVMHFSILQQHPEYSNTFLIFDAYHVQHSLQTDLNDGLLFTHLELQLWCSWNEKRAFSKIYAYEQAYSLTAALWQRFYNGCQLKVCFCLQCHLSLKITLCNWSRQLLETETHLIWDFIVILFLLIHVTQ